MFERFTEETIRSLTYAREEASQYGLQEVSPFLLLFGLRKEGTGIAARLLRTYEIDLETVRSHYKSRRTLGTEVNKLYDKPEFDERLRNCLAQSVNQSHPEKLVSTGDLLISILQNDRDFASWFTVSFDLELSKILGDLENAKTVWKGENPELPNHEEAVCRCTFLKPESLSFRDWQSIHGFFNNNFSMRVIRVYGLKDKQESDFRHTLERHSRILEQDSESAILIRLQFGNTVLNCHLWEVGQYEITLGNLDIIDTRLKIRLIEFMLDLARNLNLKITLSDESSANEPMLEALPDGRLRINHERVIEDFV
ncbi:MAG: Clp protease N-terminal domain-containing protein [Candidatus Melainabacteria bacterium]|nr:Clp protease N-terminal domain-containing protein [Candidatus Melainabacteria bacterium]